MIIRALTVTTLGLVLLSAASGDAQAGRYRGMRVTKINKRVADEKMKRARELQTTSALKNTDLHFKQIVARTEQKLPSAKLNANNGIQKIGRYGLLKVKQAHAYLSTFKVESVWKRIAGAQSLQQVLGGTRNSTVRSSLKYAIINNVPGDREVARRRIFTF